MDIHNTSLYLILFAGLSMFCLGVLGRPHLHRLAKFIARQAPLVKWYWVFVVPFLIASSIAYVLVLKYSKSDRVLSVTGQVIALVFAVFIGYLSFREVSERNFEKRYAQGVELFRNMRYIRASQVLEEAHRIKPRDASCLADLLETLAINGEYEMFDVRLERYKKTCLEANEELTYRYFAVLRQAIPEHQKEMTSAIKEMISFVEENEDVRKGLGWEFDSLMRSATFKKLGAPTKALLEKVIAYLKNQVSDSGIDNELKKAVGLSTVSITVPASQA